MCSNPTLVRRGPLKCTFTFTTSGKKILTHLRLVDGAGAVCVCGYRILGVSWLMYSQIKLTKDGNVLLREMVLYS